jgi:hypothetical protein
MPRMAPNLATSQREIIRDMILTLEGAQALEAAQLNG